MSNKKYELNESVLSYILNKLQSGHGFSQAFFKRKLSGNHHFYTYLDIDVDSENLYSIKDGIVGLNQENIWESYYDEVENYLKVENNIVLFEDAYLKKSDNYNGAYTKQFYVNENIYYFISKEDVTRDNIQTIFSMSSSAWQQLIFFTSLSDETTIENKTELSKNHITELAQRVVKVFVDAYDLDSFIVWDLKTG